MKIARYFLPVLIAVTVAVGLQAPRVSALSGSEFKAGRIMDDPVFFNGNAMSTTQIQNFLNAKVPTCDTNHPKSTSKNDSGPPYTCLEDYRDNIKAEAAQSGLCNALTAQSNQTAAQIIYQVGKACGVSQKVIIVTLQKEQALVTDSWPWQIQYDRAMGYGCPDSTGCNSNYYGFFNQVYKAAWQFKRYAKFPDTYNYQGGVTSYIQWNPKASCGGSKVGLSDQATAGLYNYTPYQPNKAALDNLYGAGNSCSAYGNRNFWRYYRDWFGSTYSGPVIEQGSDGSTEQYVVYNGTKFWITNTTVKKAWGLDKYPIYMVDPTYLNNLASGTNISGQYVYHPGDDSIYLVDSGNLYHFTNYTQYQNWGSPSYFSMPGAIIGLVHNSGNLPDAIQPNGSGTMYMMDGATMRALSSPDVWVAWLGNTKYITVSTTLFNTYSTGADITTDKFTLGGKHYLADGGIKHNLGSFNDLYTMPEMTVSANVTAGTWPEDNISPFIRTSGSKAVYAVDGSQKRHVTSSSILSAWAMGGNEGVTTLKPQTLNTLSAGNDINSMIASNNSKTYVVDKEFYQVTNTSQQIGPTNTASAVAIGNALKGHFSTQTLYENVKINGSPPVYQLINGQKAHYLNSNDYRLWNAPSRGVTTLDGFVISALFPDTSVPMSVLYTSGGNDYIMAKDGTYYLINSAQETAYGISGWHKPAVPSWLMAEFTNGGSFSQKAVSGDGTYYFAARGKVYSTTNATLAALWGISGSSVTLSDNLVHELPRKTLSLFVFVPSSGSVYIQNHDNLLRLSNVAEVYDLGYSGHIGDNMVQMDSSNLAAAAASTAEYPLPIIKNGTTYYLIDGGHKRGFINPTVQSQWVGSGSGIPLATSQLLAYLPSGSAVGKSVKASDSKPIYAGVNKQLHWIKSSATYHASFAPYATVSSQFIKAMPAGNALP